MINRQCEQLRKTRMSLLSDFSKCHFLVCSATRSPSASITTAIYPISSVMRAGELADSFQILGYAIGGSSELFRTGAEPKRSG